MKQGFYYIEKSTYKSIDAYERIYDDFWIPKLMQRKDPRITEERAESKRILRLASKQPDYSKLMAFVHILSGMSNANFPPIILKEQIAPIFFKLFPKGRIYYIKRFHSEQLKLMTIYHRVGHKYHPNRYMPYLIPNSMLDLDYNIETRGLHIPIHFTFPYILGINAPLAFGNLIFTLGTSIRTWSPGNLCFKESMETELSEIYSDESTPSYGFKRPILINADESTAFKLSDWFIYFEWYLENIKNIYNFVLSIKDEDKMFLASISISRIMSELYSIILSEIPLLRLILTFGILDKFANLSNKLSFSSKDEEQIWRDMLSDSYFKRNSKMLSRIAGLGKYLAKGYDMLAEELSHICDEEQLQRIRPGITADRLLRIYRNSYHGYLLRHEDDRRTLISHSGNIPNEFPDIIYLLWNAFISNPYQFLSI